MAQRHGRVFPVLQGKKEWSESDRAIEADHPSKHSNIASANLMSRPTTAEDCNSDGADQYSRSLVVGDSAHRASSPPNGHRSAGPALAGSPEAFCLARSEMASGQPSPHDVQNTLLAGVSEVRP